jgi:hypothetical protein
MTFEQLVLEKQTGSTYGSATVKAMAQAFEEAWAEMAPYFSQNPPQTELYRTRLAQAVLHATKPNSIGVEDIKMKALAEFP